MEGGSFPQDIYKKGAQLARGAFGAITEATRVRNGQEVVLKENKKIPDYQENLTASQSAEINKDKPDKNLKEAKVLAKLEHPNIVPVIDAFRNENGDSIMVMKKVGEGSLVEYMNTTPLTNTERVKIIKQLSSAVDYTNQQGILHRDIKPDNILIEDGNAFLTDFGNSSAIQEQPKDFLIGSPPYASPEQTQHLDEPGDSEEYSVALLAYTLIAGETVYALTPIPDSAKTPEEQIQAKMHAIATREGLPTPAKNFLLEKYKNYPQAAQNVVTVFDKALSRKPEDRFKTATEFADALGTSMGVK